MLGLGAAALGGVVSQGEEDGRPRVVRGNGPAAWVRWALIEPAFRSARRAAASTRARRTQKRREKERRCSAKSARGRSKRAHAKLARTARRRRRRRARPLLLHARRNAVDHAVRLLSLTEPSNRRRPASPRRPLAHERQHPLDALPVPVVPVDLGPARYPADERRGPARVVRRAQVQQDARRRERDARLGGREREVALGRGVRREDGDGEVLRCRVRRGGERVEEREEGRGEERRREGRDGEDEERLGRAGLRLGRKGGRGREVGLRVELGELAREEEGAASVRGEGESGRVGSSRTRRAERERTASRRHS